jgi:hypothetical protein
MESTGIVLRPEQTKSSGTERPIDVNLVKEEYFHLQKIVEDFDARVLTIKAWSVTFSMAGIAAAYYQSKPVVLLPASFSAFLFWVIEALWKTFQYANYQRLYEIEQFLSGETTTIVAPRIAHSWSTSWHAGGTRRLLRIMTWPHVLLPHAVVYIGGIVLYIIERY